MGFLIIVKFEMADPLSFFAGNDSSESESEGEAEPEETKENVEEVAREDKLPSPDTLFATVGRPAFLNTSLNPAGREVNWERFVKNDAEENVHSNSSYAAIAPPSDLESSRGNISSGLSIAIASTYTTPSHEISAAPVKYANKKDSGGDGNEDDVVETRTEQTSFSSAVGSTKRDHSSLKETDDDDDDSLSRKKAKTQTFRQKEKRKRDTGQSSRGKSYVEEEKRILRQTFATDEVMT